MAVVRRRWCVIALLVGHAAVATGCGGTADRPAVEVPVEVDLAAQVVSVRAGATREIVLRATEVGDDDLAALAGCGRLERLHLERAALTDAGLARLAQLGQLTSLNLPRGRFTDAGLAGLLTRLPQLEQLRIGSPRLGDDALRAIATLPRLRFLHLIDVPVTDAGLAHLHEMSELESFYLDGDRATDAGLTALLEALPQLHFHRDQLHLPGDPRADAHGP